MRIIYGGAFATRNRNFFQMPKFHAQHCRLQLVHAAVQATVNIVVSRIRSIIGKRAHGRSQLLVGRNDGSGIAHRPYVFCRIKAKCRHISQTACRMRAVQTCKPRRRANGLRIVFHNFHPIALRQPHCIRRPARRTIEMHHHDRFRARRDFLLRLRKIKIHRCLVDVGKNRHKPIVCDCQNGCHIRVGRHNHLISALHHSHFHIGAENQPQCVQSVAASHCMPCMAQVCQFPFKACRKLSMQIPSIVQYLLPSRPNFIHIRLIGFFQRKELIVFHRRLLAVRSRNLP